MMCVADITAVENFREYLRIPSVHPNVNYDECVKFLEKQAAGLNLGVRVYTPVAGKPIVVLTWEGTSPQLQSILLNSHMDVAPVCPEKWTRNPFAAEMDDEGNIYARGTQDTKCVGIQYLEAIRHLKKKHFNPKRTIHITFTSDEEAGGIDCLHKFVKTSDFHDLNVGFALDEGMTSEDENFVLFSGERSIWIVKIHFLQSNNGDLSGCTKFAEEKLSAFITNVCIFRHEEINKLNNDVSLTESNITSICLREVKNILSSVGKHELVATFDVRISTSQDPAHIEHLLNKWCESVGDGTYITSDQKFSGYGATKVDSTNIWWTAFKRECESMNLKLKHTVCPGVTDARCYRAVGIPALGFSPINNTPFLLHRNDEFLNQSVFLRGIKIYSRLIKTLSSL